MLGRDLRLAMRGILGSPWRSSVVIASLGIGMALTTITASFVRGVLRGPLAVRDASSLIRIREDWGTPAERSLRGVSLQTYELWSRARSLSAIAAASYTSLELQSGVEPRELAAARVTPGFFELFGTTAETGRFFTADSTEDQVVVSGRLAAASGVKVGDTIRLNGRAQVVIGVAHRGFTHPYEADVWLPLDLRSAQASARFYVPARLRNGVSADTAARELDAIAARGVADGRLGGVARANVIGLRKELLRGLDRTLPLLLGAALLVLLVAIANVSALFIADALRSRRDASIRLALGARPLDAIRFFIMRTAILALSAAAVAAACAGLGSELLVRGSGLASTSISEWGAAVQFRTADTLIAAVLGILCAAVVAVAPASVLLSAGGTAVRESHRVSLSRGARKALYSCASAQTALVVVLALFGASLVRQFLEIARRPLGYRTHGVIAADVYLPENRFGTEASRLRWIREAVREAEQTAGVDAVGATTHHPGSTAVAYISFDIDGNPAPDPPGHYQAHVRFVTPGVFPALGIELLRGRVLEARDLTTAEAWPAVINESLARRHWPGRDAIGQVMRLESSRGESAMVVGVTRDVAAETADAYLDMNAIAATIYLPITASPEDRLTLIAVGPDPGVAAAAIRSAVARRPVPTTIHSLEDLVHESHARHRFAARLGGASIVIALVLAMLGIHSVTAFLVAQQQRAIGVRLAVGATAPRVAAYYVRLAAASAAVGVLGGATITQLLYWTPLRQSLESVRPTASQTLLAAAAVLTFASLAAILPALRASEVSPASVLGAE